MDEENNKEIARESQDKKKGEEAEEIIEHVRKMGMDILNGNIRGDELGNLTFFETRGD